MPTDDQLAEVRRATDAADAAAEAGNEDEAERLYEAAAALAMKYGIAEEPVLDEAGNP